MFKPAPPAEILRIGQPTPVALHDAHGELLLAKGMLIESEEQRARIIERMGQLEAADAELLKRAWAVKLDAMLRENKMLGQIARVQPQLDWIAAPPPPSIGSFKKTIDPLAAWSSLQMRGSALLHDPAPADFLPRLRKLQQELLDLLEWDADRALLLLVQATTSDAHSYSVTHSLLVAVLCELAARQVAGLSAEARTSLRCAALTMNIAMTALQDQLALQDGPPTPAQRAGIDVHGERAVACLRAAGVRNDLWLQAVERHHATGAGPLDDRPPGAQLARLLQRADIFSARLSKRKMRPALSAAAAVKAAYLDEHQQIDQAGSAIIQITGIYPPGSYVRLRSGEIAVVLRRGNHPKEPKVASLISRHGTPLLEPTLRDTRLSAHHVLGGVAPHEVNVRLNMDKLLRLG